MKKLLFIIWFTALSSIMTHAQTGYTGINTKVPGSTLDVNGSFAAAYFSVTANTYAASESDFSIKWAGTADGTITLPASGSGPDRSGRMYFLKNASTSSILTVKGNGSELIDNSNTVIVDPGEALLMVKTDINSGSTYMILQISKTQESYTYSMSGATSQPVTGGNQVKLDFTAIDYSTNGGGDFNIATDIWTCPQTGWYSFSANAQGTSQTAANSHASIFIRKNDLGIGAGGLRYFYIPGAPLINSGSLDKVLKLIQGDQISIHVLPCSGCGIGVFVSGKQLDINRL